MPLGHETAEGLRFDGFAGDYDSRASEPPVRTIVRTRVVEIVRTLRPRVVVDVGCGTGTALITFAPSIELGVGLDVSHEMLKVAERNAVKAGAVNLKFAFGSFHDLASGFQFWPTGSRPDVIMQNYALHHLPRDEKRVVIDSMVRALSSGTGFVVLGDLMFFDDPAGLKAEYAAVGYDPQNDHPETAAVLAKMLEDSGCIVKTHQVHPLAGIVVGEWGLTDGGTGPDCTMLEGTCSPLAIVSLNSIRAYVERAIDEPVLAERIVHVLWTMPQDVVAGLLTDPCFQIAIDNYVPGRGGTVWMACPGDSSWKGSRSVVLRRRLVGAIEAFAHYVIAHELAHAHLWNGAWGKITDPEEAADGLAATWGFPRPA